MHKIYLVDVEYTDYTLKCAVIYNEDDVIVENMFSKVENDKSTYNKFDIEPITDFIIRVKQSYPDSEIIDKSVHNNAITNKETFFNQVKAGQSTTVDSKLTTKSPSGGK